MSTDDAWPAKLAALEQASAEFRDGFAPLVAAFHKALMKEGLSEGSADMLTAEFMREMFDAIRRQGETE